MTKGVTNKRTPDAERRIRDTIEKWFITEPLLFSTFLTHELTKCANADSLRSGHGRIEYRPEFIEALDDRVLEELLKIETLRIVLKHPYVRRPPSGEITYLASNITLKEHTRTTMPLPAAQDVFGDASFSKQYYEFYCDRLATKSSRYEEASAGSGTSTDAAEGHEEPSPDDAARNGKTCDIERHFDAQAGPGRTQHWQPDTLACEEIDNVIREAEMSQSWGNLSSNLVAMIRATLKPKLDYRKVLRSFGTSILATRRELTRFKPSRRYGFDCMGSRYALRTKLLVAVDVSGSMSQSDLMHAYSAINRLFQYGIETIDTIQFDAKITGPVDTFARRRFQVTVTGRGGTNFQPVLDFIDEHRDYDGLLVLTDGGAETPRRPKNRNTRVLWLFSNEATYTQFAKGLAQIGRAAFIRPASALASGNTHKGARQS